VCHLCTQLANILWSLDISLTHASMHVLVLYHCGYTPKTNFELQTTRLLMNSIRVMRECMVICVKKLQQIPSQQHENKIEYIICTHACVYVCMRKCVCAQLCHDA